MISWKKSIYISSASVLIFVFCLNVEFIGDIFLPSLPELDFEANWTDKDPSQYSNEVKQIFIRLPSTVLNSIGERLKNRGIPLSMPNSNFTYGFNNDYLNKLIEYWLHEYNWSQWEFQMNRLEQYFLTVKGLQIHVVHMRPELKDGQRSVPILLLHGWPGSFFEFYKVIPLLINSTNSGDILFEVVCPSLPGFGWSEAATRPGFGLSAMADIMFELMIRLNITEKFYVQGGDFGSFIASFMARLKPNKIAGIHVNMVFVPVHDWRYWIKLGIGAYLPKSLHFLTNDEIDMVYPYNEKLVDLIKMFGYLWIQATRPSTVAIALSDSPAGLAAYILEKFGAWSNNISHHLSSPHGGLDSIKISRDEMLTNVMIYYITNSISTSIRLYKEMMNPKDEVIMKIPIKVPAGLALFPNEIYLVPKYFARLLYRDIRQFTVMPRGGHFAALEEPDLLADDIKSFIVATEKS